VENGSRIAGEPVSEPVMLPTELPEPRVRELLAEGHDIGYDIRELAGYQRGDQYWRMHLAVQRWLVARVR